MSAWATTKREQEHERYIAGLVQLSQMQLDGRLSSTAAREVFSEFHDAHQMNLRYIEEIDAMWEDE